MNSYDHNMSQLKMSKTNMSANSDKQTNLSISSFEKHKMKKKKMNIYFQIKTINKNF